MEAQGGKTREEYHQSMVKDKVVVEILWCKW